VCELGSPTQIDVAFVIARVHGVGAKRATVAQVAEHVPRAALQPKIAAGATGAAMVPKVAPAAA